MDDKQELRLRRKAIRFHLKGVRLKVILAKVQRSRAWFSKWQKRFDQQGTAGLRSHSRRPHHTPRACSPRIERLIVRTRRRLVKQKVGLSGPRAIQRELCKLGLGKQMPSLSTILRALHRRGLIRTPAQVPPAYFPKPLTVGEWDAPCAGLDLPLSRRRPQGLCVSFAEPTNPCLLANHCR